MKGETLGGRLQRLRIEAGLTQMQLAERADVPLTTLRNWEYDRREPLATALFKLAEALGVDCRAFTDPPLRPATGKQPARPMGRPRRGDTDQASTSAEARRRMSEAHRARGTLVPGTIPWTEEEDELVRTLPTQEAVRRTRRTLSAVKARRRRLGVPDGRRRG